MMKILITIILLITFTQFVSANSNPTKLELTASYINSINELNDSRLKFEKDFANAKSKMEALKAIDDALKVYDKFSEVSLVKKQKYINSNS